MSNEWSLCPKGKHCNSRGQSEAPPPDVRGLSITTLKGSHSELSARPSALDLERRDRCPGAASACGGLCPRLLQCQAFGLRTRGCGTPANIRGRGTQLERILAPPTEVCSSVFIGGFSHVPSNDDHRQHDSHVTYDERNQAKPAYDGAVCRLKPTPKSWHGKERPYDPHQTHRKYVPNCLQLRICYCPLVRSGKLVPTPSRTVATHSGDHHGIRISNEACRQ